MILLLSLATQQNAIEKMKPDSSQKCTMSRMETNYNMGNFENTLGKKIRRRLSKPETGVAELLWNLHPCRSSKLSSDNLIQTASTLGDTAKWLLLVNSNLDYPMELFHDWEIDITVSQKTDSIRPCISELPQYINTQETKC